jgi:hypothetical protein
MGLVISPDASNSQVLFPILIETIINNTYALSLQKQLK